MSDRPLVYLILGAAGSGRREVVADLIEFGLGEGERALVLLSDGEGAATGDARLGPAGRWHWAVDRIEAPALAGATHVFLFTDGRRNPVDQIEAFHSWLPSSGGELARILCVIDCSLVAQHKELRVWFDACVHFADVVLFTHREGLPNKWMSDFQAHFAGLFLPCLFELVKAGRVKNPALILEPQARRVSHVFDEEQEWEVTGPDESEAKAGEEEVEVKPEEDPYFERLAGGRRVKVIPRVADYLPPR